MFDVGRRKDQWDRQWCNLFVSLVALSRLEVEEKFVRAAALRITLLLRRGGKGGGDGGANLEGLLI